MSINSCNLNTKITQTNILFPLCPAKLLQLRYCSQRVVVKVCTTFVSLQLFQIPRTFGQQLMLRFIYLTAYQLIMGYLMPEIDSFVNV